MINSNGSLRQLQLKCVEILDLIDMICRENNIQYSLCGGSVIGAYLYKGFIPWDDDIDLMMTRENYNKFIKVCPNYLPEGYRLQNFITSDDYYVLFTKIIDENTTLVQKNDSGELIISGVFVDITVYDKMPQNFLKNVNLLFWKIIQWIFYGRINKENSSLKTKCRNFIISTIGNRISPLFYLVQKFIEITGNYSKYTYSELFGAFCNTKEYPSYIFENYIDINFENKKYMIIRDYKDYLIHRYEKTNYEVPIEEQKPSHQIFFDLDNSYRNYILNREFIEKINNFI